MQIDPTTLLFHDLSDQEADELRTFGEALLFKGEILNPHPHAVKMWFEVGKFDDRQQLMVMSTVLPGRIFYSLLIRRTESK